MTSVQYQCLKSSCAQDVYKDFEYVLEMSNKSNSTYTAKINMDVLSEMLYQTQIKFR